jgi:ATP-dependent Clp protease protease subunit
MTVTKRRALWIAAAGALAALAPVAWSDGHTHAEAKPDHAEASDAPAEKTELERIQEASKLLAAEYELLQKRQQMELARLELEKRRIEAESALRDARRSEEMAEMKAELDRLQTEASLREARQKGELARIKSDIEEMQVSRQHAEAERSVALMELQAEAQRLAAENQILQSELDAQNLRKQMAKTQLMAEAEALQAEIQLRDTKDKTFDVVLDDQDYLRNPHQGDAVYVSDRRIALNGPIISGTADWVTQRIHYFNNQDPDLPIFIVIDDCPGGSVMQGYRIVEAIEQSDAPIHVVVKSFAASMAAVITTLADHSYAYPNAIILHHQMSSGMMGNLTQQEEQLENAKEWARRLADPVADKMGVSYDRFVELMYENNSNGDWEEFADQARELKWVNHVVDEIREVGIRRRPTGAAPQPWFWFFFGQAPGEDPVNGAEMVRRDDEGRPFVQLPPLRPFDHYFLYDPQGFFRY